MSDADTLLAWLEEHKQYMLGFAPTGDWCLFNKEGKSAYGNTVYDALREGMKMHKELYE